MSTVLGFWDFMGIALIVLLAGLTITNSLRTPSNAFKLRRLEAKVDMILRHLGLEYQDPAGHLPDDVKALADDPMKKIAAIKMLRKNTGLGLKEAKDAVEAYIASRDGRL
jgi:ribosomal protein L7/L12